MIKASQYDKNGRILFNRTFSDQETFDLNVEHGLSFVQGHHEGSTHYILDGQITERPASPVTLSDLTLLAVPTGSTLWINGESYAAEGDVELEFPLPGTYRLRVECWPYRDWEGEVTVPVVSGVEP